MFKGIMLTDCSSFQWHGTNLRTPLDRSMGLHPNLHVALIQAKASRLFPVPFSFIQIITASLPHSTPMCKHKHAPIRLSWPTTKLPVSNSACDCPQVKPISCIHDYGSVRCLSKVLLKPSMPTGWDARPLGRHCERRDLAQPFQVL